VIGDVERNLQALRPEQYLLAYVFLCSYALALGHMLERRGRALCAGLSLAAATGFVACSVAWEAGVIVVAFALVGMGAFSAAAWLSWTLASWRPAGPPRRAAAAATEAADAPVPAAVTALPGTRLGAAARSG
jgi:hypothetical protein